MCDDVRAFDVDLLHIAEHFCIPVSEVAVNWHEIPGSPYMFLVVTETVLQKQTSRFYFLNNYETSVIFFQIWHPASRGKVL